MKNFILFLSIASFSCPLAAAEDVDYVLRFLDQVKQHPTGNMHEFVGFPAIRELEERFLPEEDVVNRYENSLGYKP